MQNPSKKTGEINICFGEEEIRKRKGEDKP